MPYTYTDTAPASPSPRKFVTWAHHRIVKGSMIITKREGRVLKQQGGESGMTQVRRTDTGKTEWLPTRVLKPL